LFRLPSFCRQLSKIKMEIQRGDWLDSIISSLPEDFSQVVLAECEEVNLRSSWYFTREYLFTHTITEKSFGSLFFLLHVVSRSRLKGRILTIFFDNYSICGAPPPVLEELNAPLCCADFQRCTLAHARASATF
jgi:hypothetical protein